MTYRKEHIAGAVWSIRPRIAARWPTVARPSCWSPTSRAWRRWPRIDLARGRLRRRTPARRRPRGLARRRPAAGGHAGHLRRCRLHRFPVLHPRPPRRQRGGRARNTSPGRSASSPSSTRRSAAPSALLDPAVLHSRKPTHSRRLSGILQWRNWSSKAPALRAMRAPAGDADAGRYFALMLERLTWSRFLPSMRISFTGASRLGECTAPTS